MSQRPVGLAIIFVLATAAGCAGEATDSAPATDSVGFATLGDSPQAPVGADGITGPEDVIEALSDGEDNIENRAPATCGDGLCGIGESTANCPADCGESVCDDGVCDADENAVSCPQDCTACPDSACNGEETTLDCPEDCGSACQDTVCNGGETSVNCPQDCGSVCDDGACNGGETSVSCPLDCGSSCGDSTCNSGETSVSCPLDCGSACDDGACNGDETSESCPADCGGDTSPVPVNDAQFVSQSTPTQLTVGASFEVEVTMRNTGQSAWSKADKHYLGSENPMDNFTWSTNRMAMDNDSVVPTDGTYTFTKALTAPAEPGTYIFQWRMLQDAVAWFGEMTETVLIEVVASADPPSDENAAQFVSQTVPLQVQAGADFVAEITMLNTSQNAWSKADKYYLGSENPMDNFTWSTNRMKIANGEVVPPSQSYTFSKTLTAPDEVGFHDFQWRMVQGGVGWFGELSENLSIEVTGSDGPNDPPGAPDLSEVVWLHTDVSDWPVTATLSSVEIDGEELCLAYDKANVWPIVLYQSDPEKAGVEVVANPWVFIYQDDTWYAGTWEWLRPNQTCKKASSVAADHIKQGPFCEPCGWVPTSGQVFYFMVSGLARIPGVTNVQERSNLVEFVWP